MSAIVVALFTRAWIEITFGFVTLTISPVALFTRAWIEMPLSVTGKHR